MNGWRVWRAFESDPVRDDSALWRALAHACRDANGRIDGAEFERWLDILIWYRRGQA